MAGCRGGGASRRAAARPCIAVQAQGPRWVALSHLPPRDVSYAWPRRPPGFLGRSRSRLRSRTAPQTLIRHCQDGPPRLSRPGGAAGHWPGHSQAVARARECRGRDERVRPDGQRARRGPGPRCSGLSDDAEATDEPPRPPAVRARERRARERAARTRPAATHGRARRASDSTTTAGASSVAMRRPTTQAVRGRARSQKPAGEQVTIRPLWPRRRAHDDAASRSTTWPPAALTAAATSAARPPPAARRPAGLSARLLITPRALSAGAPKARRVQPRPPGARPAFPNQLQAA